MTLGAGGSVAREVSPTMLARLLVALIAAQSLIVVLGAASMARGSGDAVVLPSDVVVVGDAVPVPLTSAEPDPSRGRATVLDRATGNCLICHQLPEPAELFQGNIGPDLAGVGRRLTAAQIRLRIIDQSRLNAATIMPPYYRTADLLRVDPRYAGQPVLAAQDIEDVVAFLASLKD